MLREPVFLCRTGRTVTDQSELDRNSHSMRLWYTYTDSDKGEVENVRQDY